MGKKLLGILFVMMLSVSTAFAAKLPADVQSYLKKNVSGIDIRFDGIIIMPDGTVYLPLFPASFKKPENIEISETYPSGCTVNDKPEVVIFNSDFVLLKVLNKDGKKTVKKFDKPPIQVKTGLLPQDMLVPAGLVIPENIKGIIGNLDIKLAPEKDIKVVSDVTLSAKIFDDSSKTVNKYNNKSTIKELKDKNLYMVTTYSKNISVINGEAFKADYALSQISTPVDAKLTPDNKFLLVTSCDSTLLNIISIADDRVIKQLDLKSQGGEIIIDDYYNKAYIATPSASAIYVLNIDNMTLTQRIKINGRCEKLTLEDKYLLYVDKMSDNVWSIELGNDYTLRNLGKFPNISKVVYYNGVVYLSSRTKNRIAVLNYGTGQLLTEFPTVEKPIDMMVYNGLLYILGAKNNEIQVLNTADNEVLGILKINGDGFSTKFCPIPDSDLVIISDTKYGRYTVVDLAKNKVIKTNGTELPVNNILVGKKVVKIK